MPLADIFENINIPDSIVSFVYGEDTKLFSYPSIVFFKGLSRENGKGYAILIDFNDVMRIWESDNESSNDERVDALKKSVCSFTGFEYTPKKIDLEMEWEDFCNHIDFFLQGQEIKILFEKFERSIRINEKELFSFNDSLENIKIISESLVDYMIRKDNLFRIDIMNSAKTLLISADLSIYADKVKNFETEFEKKVMWLAIDCLLKKNVLVIFDYLNPKLVSKGVMAISIENVDPERFRNSITRIKESLILADMNIDRVYNGLKEFMPYFNQMFELQKTVFNDKNYNLMDFAETVIIYYLFNNSNAICANVAQVKRIFGEL